MDNSTDKSVKVVNWILGLFIISLVAILGLWFWPRQAIVGNTKLQTNADSYSVGDTILVTTTTQRNVNTRASFDIRMVCADGALEYPGLQLSNLESKKDPEPLTFTSVPLFTIPEDIFKDLEPFGTEFLDCVVRSRGTYPVVIFPGITKDLKAEFVSNNFMVVL